MSDLDEASCDGYDGESFEVTGVTFVERAEEGAVADSRAALLKIEEPELVCEVAEPPVLGISAGGDSLSSTRRR